jgi:type IV fimbrial biogenesis protein FimT
VLPTQCPETPSRSEAGFTVIELMIVLTILGVLASFAIPAFDNLIKDSRRTANVNELVGTFMMARAEAAKRGQPVTVCPIATASSQACSGSTSWSVGWMAFVDTNGNSTYESANDFMLRRYENPYSTITVTLLNTAAAGFTYPFGAVDTVIRLAPFNQSGTNATLKLCDKRGSKYARAANISTIGRAEVSSVDAAGGALTCP